MKNLVMIAGIIIGMVVLAVLFVFITGGWRHGKSSEKEEPHKVELIKVEPGIGVGRLQVSLNRDIPLYLDMDSAEPFDTLRFSRVTTGKDKGKYLMATDGRLALDPLQYSPGDSDEQAYLHEHSGLVYFPPVLAFYVTEEKEGVFRVIINGETMETAVIKSTEDRKMNIDGRIYRIYNSTDDQPNEACFLYETWEVYLKRLEYVSFHNEQEKLYDAPNGNVLAYKKILWPGVVEVDGYWIKLEGKDESNRKHSGWVQWTDGVKFLVYPIEEVYE